MVKRMLVDANHPEETRVVVLDGTRLEEFDLETSTKKQNKGNIYLAKVVRVEPSLQAAFVDYGGERHGFLAFSEIHPDYYQIPVADREALLAEAQEHASAHSTEDDDDDEVAPADAEDQWEQDDKGGESEAQPKSETEAELETQIENLNGATTGVDRVLSADVPTSDSIDNNDPSAPSADDVIPPDAGDQEGTATTTSNDSEPTEGEQSSPPGNGDAGQHPPKAAVEELGGDDEGEENLDIQRRKFVASRRYKIQEVIKRRQILLVQVVKEERGNKGAALTTYLSLAGRYCVLMPNSARGGGVSRKITNTKDRRRLKSILSDLSISDQMAVILRTAGAERSKAEVKRDYEYLLRTWNQIRETTMESRAPALIHEEANLIKRSIRDVYSRDIEEVLVEGDEGYKAAKEFMRTLTPSHAKKVQRYKDDSLPLFQRYQVESQLDAMHSPTVQLKSGGSIVFGQTEALVAIDVNSGRATKERHIEETALKTNLEAADEIARQLRLRDLAGLVVIDFIDMEENRNNHAVERRLKDALKNDRARIQVGRISHFGLLELSRQRLRPSLIETNFEVCKSCGGTGLIRSTESTSIQTLRMIEEEGLRNRTKDLTVTVHPDVALYILNYKRRGLEEIQTRYGMNVFILGDSDLIPPDLRMERVKGDGPPSVQEQKPVQAFQEERSDSQAADLDEADDDDQDGDKKRRRRRRRKKKSDSDTPSIAADSDSSSDENVEQTAEERGHAASDDSDSEDRQRKGRRRGRRGGRRRRKRNAEHGGDYAADNQLGDAGDEDQQQQTSSADTQTQNAPSESDTTDNTSSGAESSGAPDQSDPLPVQPVYEPSNKPSSRFLNVLKRGADAFMSSSSPGTSEPPADMKSEQVTENPPQQEPNESGHSDKQPEAPSPVSDMPATSESPKRGWWNHDA